MKSVSDLKVKLFADGAEKKSMLELYANPAIQGFTTNPTLMRKAGISDYEGFARDILGDHHRSARILRGVRRRLSGNGAAGPPDQYLGPERLRQDSDHQYAPGVLLPADRKLSADGIKINVTAILTMEQVPRWSRRSRATRRRTSASSPGRIADTGVDPVPLMGRAVEMLRPHPQMELIWASPRELLNVFQADCIRCHIITATPDILKKLSLIGKDLDEYSLETVQMFADDAAKSGFTL